MTHEEMLEAAERREAENRALNALDKLYEDNCAAMEMLSEIERKEQMNPVQIAVCAIGKYSDALKEIAKTEKEELKAELEAKKKENFQLVADACMKEYEEKYNRDTFPEDEHWVYMIGEDYGTGEQHHMEMIILVRISMFPSIPNSIVLSANSMKSLAPGCCMGSNFSPKKIF